MAKFVPSSFFNNKPGPLAGEGLSQLRSNQEALMEMPFTKPPKDISILDDNITPTCAVLHIDTEGNAPKDDLRTITRTLAVDNTWHDGGLLYIKAKDPAHVVTIIHSSAENGIQTVSGENEVLSNTEYIMLQLRGTSWYQMSLPNTTLKFDGLTTSKIGDTLLVTDVAVGGDTRDLASKRGQLGDYVDGQGDCNNLRKTGHYVVSNDSNAPSRGKYAVDVIANSEGDCIQIARITDGPINRAWIRKYDTSTSQWKPWASDTRSGAVESTTLYVRKDGNDANSGYEDTPQGALSTIQAALDRLATIDFGTVRPVVSLGEGQWDVNGIYLPHVLLAVGAPLLVGKGDNTIINLKQGTMSSKDGATWEVNSVKILLTKDTYILIDNCSALYLLKITIVRDGGSTTSPSPLTCGLSSYLYINGINITGTASSAFNLENGACFVSGSNNINGNFFASVIAQDGGAFIRQDGSFGGTVVGKKYFVQTNGVIRTFGSGPNWLPGSEAGGAETGGQYV